MGEGPKRGRPRSAAVDRAILDMALALFVEGGLENVSYDQISKRSGVSRAAIYRRWASRPQLLISAIEARAADPDATPPDWADRNFRARLDWFILQTPKLMLSPFYRRLAGEIIARPQAAADLTFLFNESIVRPQQEIFGRVACEHEFRRKEDARATGVRAARRLQDPRRVAGQIAHARIDLRDSHPYRSHVVSGQLKLLLEKIIARWSPARLEL